MTNALGSAPPSFDRPPASRLARSAPFFWFVVGTVVVVWAALTFVAWSNARSPDELRDEIAACRVAAPEISASSAGRRAALAGDELLARVEAAHLADPSQCGALAKRMRAGRRITPLLLMMTAAN